MLDYSDMNSKNIFKILLITLICSNCFAQRLKTNTVELIRLEKISAQDIARVSILDPDKTYHYRNLRVLKTKILDKGKVRFTFSWKAFYYKTTRRKMINEEDKKELKRNMYNRSNLEDLIFVADCEDGMRLNLLVKSKTMDPSRNMVKKPFITIEAQAHSNYKTIDTKEFCNGYVPNEVILSTI